MDQTIIIHFCIVLLSLLLFLYSEQKKVKNKVQSD